MNEKNWNYWLGLSLWPLDAACRLVCGADPNNADLSALNLPDPANRPDWVNLFHQACADDDDAVKVTPAQGNARGVKPGPFIAWARTKGHGLDPRFDVLLADAPAAKAEAPRKGLTKKEVINAFTGLHFDKETQWHSALGKNIPNWLLECRMEPGRKGDNTTSALWNPVLIATALLDKNITVKKLNAVFVDLKDWREEWQEASANWR